MKKIKKELPKAQRGFFTKKFAKLLGFGDEALEAARKKQKAIDTAAEKAKNAKKTTTKKTTKNKKSNINTSFLDKQFNFKTPSLKQVLKSPYTIPKAGLQLANENKLGTTAVMLSLAAYMRSRQPGIDQVPNIEQFNVNPNFSNDYNTQGNNTQNPNMNLDSILRNQNLLDFDKKGGRVKAKGGKVAPGMRKQGGGLKMDRNGKFYR